MFTLSSAAIVAAVALIVPLVLKLAHIRIPSIVVEILLGIVIGPQVLRWARVDEPVNVLSTLGLAFLLLLSGLEIEFDRLRGQVLWLTSAAFAASFVLASAVGFALRADGLVRSPLLVAVILSATSLGVILPILKDAGQIQTPFGQVIVAAASIAEIVPIVLLSLLFSEHASGTGSQFALLAAFLLFVIAVALTIVGIERSRRISWVLLGLQETTAEIRVRGAFALLMLFSALATKFGLEAILGAFLAGATMKLVDRDEHMTHGLFKIKLQAVGFGVFVPFFFISTGMNLDVRSLAHLPTLARVPIFFAALLIVRAVPALFYRPLARHWTQLLAAGLLQATSLSIPVVAGRIGVGLGLISGP
ncbi:MAG: sodium:proton antiporter, partial [Pseudonocardiales bacterium]|nr:sodium:proton antiporter [Pseudonocardiales bacterium]